MLLQLQLLASQLRLPLQFQLPGTRYQATWVCTSVSGQLLALMPIPESGSRGWGLASC